MRNIIPERLSSSAIPVAASSYSPTIAIGKEKMKSSSPSKKVRRKVLDFCMGTVVIVKVDWAVSMCAETRIVTCQVILK